MTARIKAYEKVTELTRALADSIGYWSFYASLPGGHQHNTEARPEARALIQALQELEAMTPLERDPSADLWETLLIEMSDGNAWVSVANAAGANEHVTTFSTRTGFGEFFDEWCLAREQSQILDTPWDEARRERRLINQGGEITLIDRGANYVIDLVTQAGCRSTVSCEGHPRGAYIGFVGENAEALAVEFERLGWTVRRTDQTLAYMPLVETVAERDAQWRRLAEEFNFARNNDPKA